MSTYNADAVREFKDAAKRASDHVNMHIAFNDFDTLRNKWMAIRLSDGDSDGVLYDTKRDAVRHQLHETQCAYLSFRNMVGGATPRDMAIFLAFSRDAYANGMRLPDPDDVHGGPDVLPTQQRIDVTRVDISRLLAELQ